MNGWIKDFITWTEGLPSPVEFRKWSAIYAVASAVRRRVWTNLVPGVPVYPNLFLFIVGPPGVGKTQALQPMGETLRKSSTVKLAPNDVSKQSLLDALQDAKDGVTGPEFVGGVETFHYLALVIRELSNFMSQYDGQLAGLMTDIFDNPPVNEERKRTNNNGNAIVKPSLSMIAGTATKNLGKTISGDLWGQGFMSRIILIYSADQPKVEFFGAGEAKRTDTDPELVKRLSRIGALKGAMVWTPEAQEAFKTWYSNGCAPIPQHAKLVEYNARRFLHVTKLAMTSALADERMEITHADFWRARMWLEQAERAMPEIFKEMTVHSDGEVLKELHMHMWSEYTRTKKPIPAVTLTAFLFTRVAARDIARLLEVAENGGLMDRMAGTSGPTAQYKPLPGNAADIVS
ncbi:hypothetical protein Kuura_025 [Caulobacter phage Kuura]|nr:hypothetical protein Kuura_025 [Caulobacter phage Kuura]